MMKPFDAFIDSASPSGISVYQLTQDPKRAALVYPDKPSFLADGRRLIVLTSQGPAICDPDDNGSLRYLFPDEKGEGVRVTYDGRYAYYREKQDGDVLSFHRLDLETLKSEAVFHAEGTLPDTKVPVSKFSLDTISTNNGRAASCVHLGDGKTADAPFGIMSLDFQRGEFTHVAQHRDFINPHLQYCRSTDATASRDLLVQMNHGASTDAEGKTIRALGPPADGGCDLHVVADDGNNWRDLPFGRDGQESCIGHQVWRGTGTSVATVTLQNIDNSYGWADGTRQEVVAGWPAPGDKAKPDQGRLHPEARRVLLSEGFENPRFCHLSCDATGRKWALDTFPIFDGNRAGMHLYIGSTPDENSPLSLRYVLNTGVIFSGASGGYHAHPILAPDGSMLLFNSNITGTPQVYLVRGLEY